MRQRSVIRLRALEVHGYVYTGSQSLHVSWNARMAPTRFTIYLLLDVPSGAYVHERDVLISIDYVSAYTWGRPLITYAPRGRGGGQVSFTFPVRITCKKEGRGSK